MPVEYALALIFLGGWMFGHNGMCAIQERATAIRILHAFAAFCGFMVMALTFLIAQGDK